MDIYATFEQMNELVEAIYANEVEALYELAMSIDGASMEPEAAYFTLLETEDEAFIEFTSSIHDLRWMAELVKSLK